MLLHRHISIDLQLHSSNIIIIELNLQGSTIPNSLHQVFLNRANMRCHQLNNIIFNNKVQQEVANIPRDNFINSLKVKMNISNGNSNSNSNTNMPRLNNSL
eukprot:jgi/Psemu1/310284/fgenesh1_kg.617_\